MATKIKLKKSYQLSDTTKPKMDTLMSFKRKIGDTAAVRKLAEEAGVQSASDALKKRLEELKKKKLENK